MGSLAGDPGQNCIHAEIVADSSNHFTVDLKRRHLFIVSQSAPTTVEMFDLTTGDHLQSIGRFTDAHSSVCCRKMMIYGSRLRLFISVLFIRLQTFTAWIAFSLIDGSATGKGDSAGRSFYDAARSATTNIGNRRIFSPSARLSNLHCSSQGKLVRSISGPGNHVESMARHLHHRLYVNIRISTKSALIGFATGKLITTWNPTPEPARNTSLAVDHPEQ